MQYILRTSSLSANDAATTSNLLPATFTGRSSRKGRLAPSESASITLSIWATRPGAYSLDGWRLQVEVLESTKAGSMVEDIQATDLRARHCYEQGPQDIGETYHVTVIHCI